MSDKNLFDRKSKILITCPIKMTSYLRMEVEALGLAVLAEHPLGIETEGSINDCIKLNINLRTGHRVLYLIKNFKANGPDDLYKNLVEINWEDYLYEDGYFSVVSNVFNSKILDTRFPNLKSKDAIVDRFQKVYGKRPDSGPDRNKAVINLHWKNEDAAVYLDTSGETIAKHGYRKIPFKAPLLETLAAAIIYATKWKEGENFINPMCGSGTLAIEAALLATNRVPGLFRSNYAFMHYKGFDKEVYENIRSESKARGGKKFTGKIIASDIDINAIEAAKRNAATAGVDHLIDFIHCDFRETPIPSGGGVVVFNPEYGERLGEEKPLEEIYGAIGDFFKKKCKGYMGYIFTGNFNLAKKIGLKTKRRIEFYNSTIECRLLEYELYEGTRKHKEDTLP